MPSTKRSIAEANGAVANKPLAGQDELRAAPATRAPDPRQVSTDERKPEPAKRPPSASDGAAPVDASSLLILGPDCLSHLTRHLDVVSLARFGGVCKQFRHLAIPRWEALDAQIPAKGKSKAESPRLRVIRHHMAANACKEIEPMIAEDDKYEEDANSRCQFPGGKYVVDTDIRSLEAEGTDQNPHHHEELFCRFVEKSSGTLLAQGFCTAKSASAFFKSKFFFVKDLDLSNWPAMKVLVETVEGSTVRDLRTALEKIMEDLSVVVVAISKEVCPEIRVVSAVNKMEDRDSFGMQGRRRFYSREMKTMFIHTTSNGPYIFFRLKRIVTSFKVGDRHERECDGQVSLKIETYD